MQNLSLQHLGKPIQLSHPPHLRVYRSDLQLLSASGEKLDNPVMGRANAVNQVVENQ